MSNYNRIKSISSKDKKIDLENATIYLRKTGILLKLSNISQEKFKSLKKAFTIKIPSGIPSLPPQSKSLYTYAFKKKYILLPRFGVFSKCYNYNLVNEIKENKSIPLKWNGSLNDNQKIIYEHILHNIFNEKDKKEGKAGCILKLGAGRGKSFIAAALFIFLKKKCLLITHSTNMVFQWADLFKKWAPEIKVGYWYGKKKTDGDIVISIINTVAGKNFLLDNKEYDKQTFFDMFDFIICDECQLMLSSSGEKMYRRFQSPYMLGLSATPDENAQGKDCIAWWNLGSVLDAESIKDYKSSNVSFTGCVKMIKYLGPHQYTKLILNEKLGVTSVPKMITQMMLDPYRKHVIAINAKKLQEKGYNTFIFADRRQYLLDIKDHIRKLGLDSFILEEKVKRLVGGSTAEDMKIAEKYANIILTTYQYMSVGKSIPKMNAIILASPRKNYNEQTIKRIFRLGSDSSIERQIIDIVDWKTPMKSQWYSRRKYFISQKYPIEIKEIKWEDIFEEANIILKKEDILEDVKEITVSDEVEKLLDSL